MGIQRHHMMSISLATAVLLACLPLVQAAPPGGPRSRSGRPTSQARVAKPQVWQHVRRALMAQPMHSYGQVAKSLRKERALAGVRGQLNASYITSLVDRHEGRRAIKQARDRAVAERVAARVRAAPAGTNLRSLARMLAPELPGIKDHNLAKLKGRHPDLLGSLSARAMHTPVPPAARAAIKELALAHPTLDYAALATVFSSDPRLANVLPWSEQQVSRLREPSRILPSETKRRKALARLAADHLGALPETTGLADGVASLSRQHPGADHKLLLKLAPREPQLARAMRRLQLATQTHSRVKPAPLDLALARQANPGRMVLQRTLEQPGSPLTARLSAQLAGIVRSVGHNDQHLSPRDLAGTGDPVLATVMRRVYQQTGRKRLSLQVINGHLPAAIAGAAHAARNSKASQLSALYQAATAESLAQLSVLYQAQVLGQGQSRTAFAGSQRLPHATWKRLQSTLPGHFPRPGTVALSGERLQGVTQLYNQLLQGQLTTTGFYKRAKVTAAQLRLLQATDPTNFPRPAGTPSWKTVAGRRDASMPESSLQSLSRAWHEQVMVGQQGVKAFQRQHGVSHHKLSRLYNEHPELFPRRGRWPARSDNTAAATEVGRRATAVFKKDVLSTQADIIRVLNADTAFVARHGRMTRNRYEQLHLQQPHRFPPLKQTDVILGQLAQEVRGLLKAQPDLTPVAIAAQMKQRHPRFKRSRVDQLRRTFPGLIPAAGVVAVSPTQRLADARLLARKLRQAGGERGAIAAISTELCRTADPRFTRDYLYRLRKEFSQQLFSTGVVALRPPAVERSSRPVAQLLALAVQLSAPGTGERDLGRAVNRLLKERGLAPFADKIPTNITRRMSREHGTLTAQNARATAQVVAEYARAAPRGATQQQIFARVLADYPSLDRQKLSTYRRMWSSKPASYPALAKFYAARGGKLSISGRGEQLTGACYLGGWSVERALLQPAGQDSALAARLASFSQYARIPTSLPLLDQMVADLGRRKPLRGHNVLWVSHLLATSVPLARALRSAGTLAKSAIVVGTPYGTNPAVRKTLAEDGFDVRVPRLSVTDYQRKVERAVDDMVKLHRRNHKPVVVLDDGGLVTKILHSNPRYRDVLGAFKIVEQTTRGITLAEQQQLKVPVINVARSVAKKAEGRFIGAAVSAKVLQGLGRLGRTLDRVPVTVMGYGVVGRAVARELRKAGALVTVVEPSTARARAARKARFTVAAKEQALAGAKVVIGATGKQSLSLADLRRLPANAVVASASSKQVEFDMQGLVRAASARRVLPSGEALVRLPTAQYQLGRKRITVLGDGWPVNFDGDVEDIPARQIQLTRAVMFAGAIQAAGTKACYVKNRRLIPLAAQTDRQILDRFKLLQRQPVGPRKMEVHDPARWQEVIRSVAGSMAGQQ